MKILLLDKSESYFCPIVISEEDLISFEIDGKEYEVSIQELIAAHLELLEEAKENETTHSEE